MDHDLPEEKHIHQPLNFPKGFLWGTSTSAYQVEGNNIHTDWWEWEQTIPENKRSKIATDQYHRFEEDFQLIKDMNNNAHRLSIEWARIEPEEGKFDLVEIEHYQNVLKSLKEKDITVMLTLWHYTLPKWFSDKGGFRKSSNVKYFKRYVETIVPELKEYVDLWITINEPEIYTWHNFSNPRWPYYKKSLFSQLKMMFTLANAHKQAYKVIHKHVPNAQVGSANNIQSYHAWDMHSLIEQIAVFVGDSFGNHFFYTLTIGHHDFLGVNYYFHNRIRRNKGLIPENIDAYVPDHDISDLGWEINPQGLFNVLTDLSGGKPIYITECGIASTNDDRRIRFLISYLQEVYRAIKSGVEIKGFFYWSLLDNFEWADGYEPRFGLIEVDYRTQKRIPRPSYYVYGEIARQNSIPHQMMRFVGHTVKAEEVLCNLHDGPKAFCEHIT